MIKKYWKEAMNREVIENEKGFVSYQFNGEICYIVDIYVEPEHRKSNVAASLADQVVVIAKDKGCKFLMGTVNLQGSDPSRSMMVLLSYGFKIHSQDILNTVLMKQIGE